MTEPRYDFVLFGATGFTGREALRYLAGCSAATLGRWAVAGRNEQKLRQTLAELLPGRDDVGIIQADSSDDASVDQMVAQARCLIHLAGPYARHGESFIRACVRHGCHYVDLNGEALFAREMIERHHEAAAAARVKIVFTAGFEALPFDIGTLQAVRELADRHGEECARVDVYTTSETVPGLGPGDFVSGGTTNTLRESLREGLRLPHAGELVLDGERAEQIRRANPIPTGAWFDGEIGEWVAPNFPMPFINPPILHRSAELFAAAGEPYGPTFGYRESTRLGPAEPGKEWQLRIGATGMGALIQGMSAAAGGGRHVRGFLLTLLDRFGPQTGEGPSELALAGMSYTLDVRATGIRGARARVEVHGEGHPGYRSTARMIVATGLSLAFDGPRLPQIYGVITPATGVGLAAAERFADAGLRFTTVDGDPSGRADAA